MAEFKQMSLRQCAQFDQANGIAGRLTGWGKICRERHIKGISRKQIRVRKQAKEQKNG